MKTNSIIAFILLVISTMFIGCEDSGESPVMLENPLPSYVVSMPDMKLERKDGADVLSFEISPIEVGFTASVNYIFEASLSGTNFEPSVILYSGSNVDSVSLTKSELNAKLLGIGDPNVTADYDFRVRAIVDADAGNGVKPHQLISKVKTKAVSTYGLLRLQLIGVEGEHYIKSINSDGIYTGYVKLNSEIQLTLLDPETKKSYGFEGGVIKEDAETGFNKKEAGWYFITIDLNAKSIDAEDYRIGLVGNATPNEWETPDSKMDYIEAENCWTITLDLTDGMFKFRKNDGWTWNLGGQGEANGSLDNYSADNKTIKLISGGVDLPLLEGEGNYTIKLFIEQNYAVVIKNN